MMIIETRNLRILFLALLIGVAPSFADSTVPAAASPAENAPLTLDVLIKNTLERNGMIQETLQDIEMAKAQVDQARAAVFPHGQAVILAAPIFEERGNALHSDSNWSKWGPYVQGGFQLVQPLYSFGQLSSYRKAADNQLLAKTELSSVKKAEVVVMLKEFYYSYLMACSLESLVNDLISFLEEATKTAEKNVGKKGQGAIKQHDVYRLKTSLDDLKQKVLLAKAGRQTAERAVSWVSATQFESLKNKKLVPEEFTLKTMEEYQKLAKAKRPEFRALAAGQEARQALRDAKRAQSYPIFFVGAFGLAAWSPVRDKQYSAYVNDPFNNLQGGVGFGLKFDLEFTRHSAEAAEQEAEAMKLKATESYAVPGIDLQVKKAYWDLEQAKEGLLVAEHRKETSKKWFVGSAMGWSIGLTPAKDLMEALEGDGLAKKNYIETVFSLNMAIARLTQAIGEDVTKLKN
jgi:outer membrane protein TolC